MPQQNDDGGPAFPVPISTVLHNNGAIHTRDSTEICLGGMSLRDYFAAHAPEEEIENTLTAKEAARELGITAEEYLKDASGNYFRYVSQRRYRWADAMLAARKAVRA